MFLKKLFQQQTTPIATLSNPAVAAMIDEAITVINDIAEAGKALFVYSSGEFTGAICPLFQRNSQGGYSVRIEIWRTGDLRGCTDRRPLNHNNPADVELMEQMENFLQRYKQYYDANKKGYTYVTKNSFSVSTEELLKEQIKLRCPKIVIRNGLYYIEDLVKYL